MSDPDDSMQTIIERIRAHDPDDFMLMMLDPTAEAFYKVFLPWQMLSWTLGAGNSVRYAFSFAFDRFIMIPFGAFTFGVLVRIFLYVQDLLTKHTKMPYWATVMLVLPPFLVLECVCCMRIFFQVNY